MRQASFETRLREPLLRMRYIVDGIEKILILRRPP